MWADLITTMHTTAKIIQDDKNLPFYLKMVCHGII